MTLIERYQLAKSQPKPATPAMAFIRRIAEVTKKSDLAVRRWLAGETVPDALTQQVLADHFKTTPQDLFPNK